MIRAWPETPSLDAGGTLVLHVRGAAAPYAVQLYRCGRAFERASVQLGPFSGERAEAALPATLAPGAYVAHVYNPHRDAPLRSPDARHGTALFVVRRPAAAIAVNLPLFTYHAYNVVGPGGDCLYTGPTRVSLQRPGGGTGGHTWDEAHVDVYDPASPRQTFAHWDAPALAWLERHGDEPAVCTDLDLHTGVLPKDLRLLLAFGHQEYWTREMRASVASLLERGVNVALFCGNTSWFRVRYDASAQAIVRDGRWSDDDPEESLIGTSYRFGGGRWRGPRPPSGYTVRDAAHWIFEDTGLRDGDVFGAADRLLGYECDGAAAGEHVVAAGRIDAWNVSDGFGEINGGRADLIVHEGRNATLVNVATVDWARVMQHDRVVARITRNVAQRLSV